MDKNKLIDEIILSMTNDLTTEQLQRLENTLVIKMHGYTVERESTELVVSERHWERILKTFLASKKLENCSDGTLAQYGMCIRMMMESLNLKIKDITTNDIRYYLAHYQETRKISASYLDTIRRYISSFFSWCCDEGYIDRDPSRRVKRVRVPQKIKQAYADGEREVLKCTATTLRDVALMEVLYCTAARIGEIIAVNREDVDWNSASILIYGEKGKKERRVYLTGAAMYHLKQYLDSRTDNNPALFVSLKAPYQRLGKAGAESMIRKIGIAAGIHAHPHKFRRSWITDNHAKGMDIAYIQEYAGHVKLETTRLYITIDESAVRNAYFRYAS